MICIVVGHETLDAVLSGESHYGSFVMKIVQEQLAAGTAASAAEVPTDVPTCKKNLLEWLSLRC